MEVWILCTRPSFRDARPNVMKTNNEWIIEIPFLLRNGLISLWVKRFFNLSPKAVIAKSVTARV